MSKNIPIKNIFYLLIYAWDRYQEGKSVNLEIEKAPDLPNLLSNLLFKLMCRVIKKGLDKDYFEENETSSFIKISNNTKWIKTRSKEFNTSIQNYSKVIDETPVSSITFE